MKTKKITKSTFVRMQKAAVVLLCFVFCFSCQKPDETEDIIGQITMTVKANCHNVPGRFRVYISCTDSGNINWGDGTPDESFSFLDAQPDWGDGMIWIPLDHVYSDTTIVYKVVITGKNITSMSIPGVPHYSNALRANGYATSLDASKNTALTFLNCANQKLTNLELGDNSTLTELDCSDNRLITLNVSKCTALTNINCNVNRLTSLDVGINTALTYLRCDYNQLTSLNLSNNEALTYLRCFKNQLTSLDISKNIALVILECSGNQLTSLDLSKNTALVELLCTNNQLTRLDVNNNSALFRFICSDNQLTSLDLSKNTALRNVECESNNMTVKSLNDLFETIHSNDNNDGYTKTLFIGGNPGTVDCNISIAENKGWSVYY